MKAYELSRAEREEGSAERAAATFMRSETSTERDAAAALRDEMASLRDQAAQARDEAAEQGDREFRVRVEATDPLNERLKVALEAAEATRAEARDARARAAADRERGSIDREHAAEDRAHTAADLKRAHLDDLTGAYRRDLGTVALHHEIERARRSDYPLMLAYVDVDGLKRVNDEQGHAAGDDLLREVAVAIRSKLRPYDPIVRIGGDEFICTFLGDDIAAAESRFEEISSMLAGSTPEPSISVGFAALRPAETLEELIARGDAALYRAKRDA